MRILEIFPDYNIAHEMPKELWDEIKLLKLTVYPRMSISKILLQLPQGVKALVKTGRKRKTIPNGATYTGVFIDEVITKQDE